MKTSTDVRDIIFSILVDVYSTSSNAPSWYTEDDLYYSPKQVTINILAIIAYAHLEIGERGDYEPRTLFNSIQQAIWMVYPGGTTAAHAAIRICDKLGIDYDSDTHY